MKLSVLMYSNDSDDKKLNKFEDLICNTVELHALQELAELSLECDISTGVFSAPNDELYKKMNPHTYRDAEDTYKDQEHFLQSEILKYDFDNKNMPYCTSKQIKEALDDSGVSYIILASKSWSEDKEKMHVLIPMDEPIIDKDFLKYVSNKFYDVYLSKFIDDTAVKNDCARYLKKHKKILYINDNGKFINVAKYKRPYEVSNSVTKYTDGKNKIIKKIDTISIRIENPAANKLYELKDTILSKFDILEYIGRYVDFKYKKGNNHYYANCPFHKENTPSFYVDTEYKTWFCWHDKDNPNDRCGGLIDFMMRFHKITFWESLNILADEVGFGQQKLKEELQLIKETALQTLKGNTK